MYNRANSSLICELQEINRQMYKLEMETETLISEFTVYRYSRDPADRERGMKSLDLLKLRGEEIGAYDFESRGMVVEREELADLEKTLRRTESVLTDEGEHFFTTYDKTISLLREARSQERDITENLEFQIKNLIDENSLALRNRFLFAFYLVLFVALLMMILFLTERKNRKNNQHLLLSENKFRMIFDESFHLIGILDREGIVKDINKTALDLIGMEKDDVIGKPFAETGWWKDSEESRERIITGLALARNGDSSIFEALHRDKSGNTIYVDVSVKPILDIGNNVEQIIIEGMNISRRKMSEDHVSQLRNFLRDIINSMPSRLIVVDRELRITMANSKVLEELDLLLEQISGKSVIEVYPFLKSHRDMIRSCMESGMSQTLKKQKCQVNDQVRFNDITIFPLDGEGYDGAAIRMEDITDNQQLEDLMFQSEKMLSVGGLAAGMAHEINNPLAGMIQTAEVLYNRLGALDIPGNRNAAEKNGIEIDRLKKYMEERQILSMLNSIREAGGRAADIVDNMLSFVKREGTAVSTHDLSELLDQTLDLARTDYDLKNRYDFMNVEIRRECEEEVPPVPCESVKIQQVLLSIIKNGAEAMYEYRKNRREEGTVPEKSLMNFRIKYDKAEKMVIMEIEDNGPGMKESVRKRIFEPFFTTKGVGKGTGLGLSVSYFIIQENHRGILTVESEEGKGAKFIIRLPAEQTDYARKAGI